MSGFAALSEYPISAIDSNAHPTVSATSPADSATSISLTPTFEFTGTDPEGNVVRYEVQVDTTNTFDSQVVDRETILYDNSASAGTTTSSTITWSHTIGAGSNRMLVVGVSLQGSTQPTATAVTYGGVSMTKVLSKQASNSGAGFFHETSKWLLPAPAVGTANVVVTATSGSSPDNAGWSESYFGVEQSTTPDATATASGTTTGAQTLNITNVVAGAWASVTYGFAGDGSRSITPNAGITTRQTQDMAININGMFKGGDTNGAISTPTTTDVGATVSGATNRIWTMCAITLAPAPIYGSLIDAVSSADAGFSGSPDNSDPYTSGQTVAYTVQPGDALTASTTYYWRVRAKDPLGSNVYGSWSTPRSFTTGTGGYTLAANSGSVANTGTAASLRRSLKVVATSGAISNLGTLAGLVYNRRVTASSGLYLLTGTAANLKHLYTLSASSDLFSIIGTVANLELHHVLVADSGSNVITGQNALTNFNRKLTSDFGAISVTGTDVTLDYQQGYRLVAESGAVSITGYSTRVVFDVFPVVSGRSYYIDEDGNFYWVLSQSIGLIKKSDII